MFWRKYKDKEKEVLSDVQYGEEELLFVCSMFKYDGLEDDFTRHFEKFLNLYGTCAVFMYEGELVCSRCERVGQLNVYGELVDLVCTMENGKQVRFENFEKSDKVVYVRNNDHSEPDTRIGFTSYLFTEIDKSITSLTISARETNLIKAESKAQFEALVQVIDKAKLGQPYIISSQALNTIESENALQVFPLNDASTCDKIQYLCRAYDDIQKRFFEHYGLEVCATTKLAQQTAEESKQGCNARKVVPFAKMKTRKQAVEEINEKFGLSASVQFSDAWYEEIVKVENEGGVEDELEEDTGKSDDNGTANDDQ